jgi:hypothetical protein
MGLSNEEILKLLAEDAKPKRTGGSRRGPRQEDTSIRQINVWFKLRHHICLPDCEHRKQSPTGRACWNSDCVDPRPSTDRGINAVAEIKGQWMCRYCFLNGWLL